MSLADLPPLPVSFFARPTRTVARELVGKLLVRRRPDGEVVVARLTEVEAYLGPKDAASHARFGMTARSAILYGPPGRAYVYLIYGMHHCLNIVTDQDGVGGAVLLRGATVLEGPGRDDAKTLRGPGKLCAGLQITMRERGMDVTADEATLHLADAGGPRPRLAASPRVGVDYAGAWAERLLRFYIPGEPSVSGPRASAPGAVRGAARGGRPPRG